MLKFLRSMLVVGFLATALTGCGEDVEEDDDIEEEIDEEEVETEDL